jgi:hypothetical protein
VWSPTGDHGASSNVGKTWHGPSAGGFGQPRVVVMRPVDPLCVKLISEIVTTSARAGAARAGAIGAATAVNRHPILDVMVECVPVFRRSPLRRRPPIAAVDEPRDVARRAAAFDWRGGAGLVAATRTSARAAWRWTAS